MAESGRLLKRFLALCALPGPSGRERAVAEAVVRDLAATGLAAREDGAAEATGGTCGNLLAELAPSGAARSWVTLVAHLDAVPPGHATEPYLEGDRVLSRRGILAADDRAGVALLLELLDLLRAEPLSKTGVQAVFTVSEETGVAGADHLEPSDLRGEVALVLDTSGPPGTVNTASPDARRFEVRFSGRAAHAGVEPEKGVNALVMASKVVAALPSGRLDGDTTFNATVLQCGDATNVIPEAALLRGEARSFREGELDRLFGLLEGACTSVCGEAGGTFEMTLQPMFHPFALGPDHPTVAGLRRAAEACGLQFVARRSGGGSDANPLNAHGIPAVNLAVGYYKNHSDQEYQVLSELEGTLRLVLRFLRDLDAGS